MSDRNKQVLRQELSEKLLLTQQPYSSRMGSFMLVNVIKEEQLLRSFTDCVIELESLNNKYLEELIQYKMMYGDLDR